VNNIFELLQEIEYATSEVDDEYLDLLEPQINSIADIFPDDPDVITMLALVQKARSFIPQKQYIIGGFNYVCI
jgi:hypothetical protein